MNPLPGRRALAATALLVFAWLAATAGLRPLMLPDEGRYVGVAWEMLRSGDWLTPTLNGLPFFHKPPLFYWITAGAIGLFGHHDMAARAAPLLGAGLGAMALFLFLCRWSGRDVARLALVALLAQPLFLLGGQFANLDMLVAGCITATVLLLADTALAFEQGQPRRRGLPAAYAFAAAGVLAKGLIGVVIPVLVVGAWLLLRRRWRTLGALWSWPGAALFALLALPWFAAMELRFPGFLNYFFVVQHFKRFAAAGFNNVQPFWFYPAVLLLLSLPWLPWLAWRPRLGDVPGGPVRLLMIVWALAVVLFFSWPKSKLVGYVLPAVPPLAALMAEGFVRLAARWPRARQGWRLSVGVSTLVAAGAVAALALQPMRSTREIAATLAAQRAPHEPVLMLGGYFYDLAWYGGLHDPAFVVEDWAGVGVRDDWRKELADAGGFDPAQARQWLVDPARLPAALCAAPVAWVVGPAAAASQPLLAAAETVRSVRGTTLWRVSALPCAGRPNGDPADR